jgi:hypothetical protein
MSPAPGAALALRIAMAGIALAGLWAGMLAWRPDEGALGALGDALAVASLGAWLVALAASLRPTTTSRHGGSSDAEIAGARRPGS